MDQEFIKRSRACKFVSERNELIKKLEKEVRLVSLQYYCATKGGYCGDDNVCIALVSQAHVSTIFGEFQVAVFQNNKDSKEHLAITRGELDNAENVPVRIHSQCQL